MRRPKSSKECEAGDQRAAAEGPSQEVSKAEDRKAKARESLAESKRPRRAGIRYR